MKYLALWFAIVALIVWFNKRFWDLDSKLDDVSNQPYPKPLCSIQPETPWERE